MTRSYIALACLIGLIVVPLYWIGRQDSHAEPLAVDSPGEHPPRGYVCYRVNSPPAIDGKLDDAAWAAVPWSEPFRDIEGDLQPDPPLRTRVKMVWDDKALYIAAELEEPHVWGTLKNHDAVIFHDNDFEVFLDPDSDSHAYGELELNALNTTWDLLLTKPYRNGGLAINAWEITGLRTAVHVDGTLNDPRDRDRGWTVEIAWPWKGLEELSRFHVPPRDGDQWRINFSRVEWDVEIVNGKYTKVPKRPEHNWVWSPQGTIDMHRPEKWGILHFSTAAPDTIPPPSDPAQLVRDYLHRILYAQTAYRRWHGRYADELSQLGTLRPSSPLSSPRLEATRSGFEASVHVQLADGTRERWRIRDDGQVEEVTGKRWRK